MSKEMEEYIKKENNYLKILSNIGVLTYEEFNNLILEVFNKSKYTILNETNVKLLENNINDEFNKRCRRELYKIHIFISNNINLSILPANQETFTLMERGGHIFIDNK